jgi:adenylate cyclase
MIAGNVGAGTRLIYTIVGDAVNQAARLQVQTRVLSASVLVTESTRQALSRAQRARLSFCGRVALKGRASEVPVWAVEC